MNVDEIGRLRLHNLCIACPGFVCADEAVGLLGALQGQDYAGALWSIGLRMATATEQHVEEAIANGTIVRTWPMRGTLHFVATADVRWLLKLLTPRMIRGAAGRYRQLALDEKTFARSQDVFVEALQGGQQRTRDELYGHLERAGISTAGQRGYHLLARAAQDGLICFGAMQEKVQTFVLLDEVVAPTAEIEREDALARLALRYFASHGPATVADLARWAGMTKTDAKRGLAAVQDELRCERLGDEEYWLPPEQPELEGLAETLYLLPGFDEFVLGYGDRSAVLAQEYAERICPGGNGVFRPTIVSGGQIVGTWRRTLKKETVIISPEPFIQLSKAELERFDAAAQRYAEFLGLEANVQVAEKR